MGGLEVEIKQRANGNRPTVLGSSTGPTSDPAGLKKASIEPLYRIDTGKNIQQGC
jgi:hypothetical protein